MSTSGWKDSGSVTRYAQTELRADPVEGAITIYADGLCEPFNPGGTACWGWVAVAPNGRRIAQCYGLVGVGPGMTNNVAEYHAVISALEWAAGYRERIQSAGFDVVLRTDSQLVARQLTGEYRCTAPVLVQLYGDALLLVSQAGASVEWIGRAQNSYADMLSRKAYSEAQAGRLVAA